MWLPSSPSQLIFFSSLRVSPHFSLFPFSSLYSLCIGCWGQRNAPDDADCVSQEKPQAV